MCGGGQRIHARSAGESSASISVYPCQRFDIALARRRMTRGPGVGRYSFTVMDSQHLPSAGLPAHHSETSRLLKIDFGP
jgi:hypothetical protein